MTPAQSFRRMIVVDSATVAQTIRGFHEGSALTLRDDGSRFAAGAASALLKHGYQLMLSSEESKEQSLVDVCAGTQSGECAVSLRSHIMSVRTVRAGEGVSYGARFVAEADTPVGLAPIGFADGIDRKLTGELRVRVAGAWVPVIGRIAMDSISLDLSSVSAAPGDRVEVYGSATPTATGAEWSARDSARFLDVSPAEIVERLSERAEVVWL